nr:DUF4411 family protein [Rhodoferax sp.]
MPLTIDTLFSFDSSALIHAWHRAYRPKNFPTFWTNLEQAVLAGHVVASTEVLAELEKKDDDVHKWCKRLAANLSVDVDDVQQEHMRHIMGTYPRLVDTVKGRSGADPFVIAVARSMRGNIIVVSEEDFGKKESPKIPDVCRAEGIRCHKLADFIDARGWTF